MEDYKRTRIIRTIRMATSDHRMAIDYAKSNVFLHQRRLARGKPNRSLKKMDLDRPMVRGGLIQPPPGTVSRP